MTRIKTTLLIVFLLILAFVILVNLDRSKDEEKVNWKAVREADIAEVTDGWKTPIWLEVNTPNWEDSAYISGDGNTLYFAYYPGDLIADLLTWDFKDDIDVYISEKPFKERKKFYISEDIWSEAGVMISNGDFYYMSNRKIGDERINDNIYRNGVRLDFGTEENEEDPHYCKEKDELYFWKKENADGEKIYVYKNKEVRRLPSPINGSSGNDIQPFLTEDCQTIYFTSGRDGIYKIYRSERFGENEWSEPVEVISSKYGVGEPTLTDDGRFLFFIQLFMSNDGKRNADIMYTERE